jgi:tetratricopeptide (TPR) repeat protein
MKRLTTAALLLLIAAGVSAQKAERQNIRKGNKQYDKENYTQAEIDYRKSQEVNPNSPWAAFNLGNALYRQQKFEDAAKQYGIASQNCNGDKQFMSESLYNTGNIFMAGQDYAKAVEAYKQSLRINPADNEARYNLALAQKLLKDQQQQQQSQDQDQDQNQDQQQQQQDQKQDQNKDQNKDQNQDKQDQNQQQQPQNQDQQQQQQPQSDKISKEMAEQILNAMNQDEKETQEKVKRQQMQQMQRRKVDKEW